MIATAKVISGILRAGLPALAALALAGSLECASASDAAYTMGNYPVEATAANAVAAKEHAIADGQRAAFRSLLKRIVPVTAYKQLARLGEVKVANLISGVSVRAERNSVTDYIASLDFAFDADGVRAALSQQGIPFVDQQASSVTLITAIRQGNPLAVANDKGVWRRAWTGLDLDHTVTPVAVEDFKPTIHADTVDMLLKGDDNGLRILSDEYGTKLVVLALAEPDLAARKLQVTLAGQDAVGPFVLKRTYKISNGDLAYTAELAAVISLGVMEGRWKALKSPVASIENPSLAPAPVWSPDATASGNGEPVNFIAEYVSSDQWNNLRGKLLNMPGVDSMQISSASDSRADISLRYPGGASAFAAAVSGQGLSFFNSADGWVLRPNY